MRTFTTVALLLSSTCAVAAFWDGHELVLHMRDYELLAHYVPADRTVPVSAGDYRAYILGVFDVLTSNGSVCIMHTTTAGEVSTVVTEFLEANPQRWSEPAYVLVRDALQEAFPCGPSHRKPGR